uniref:Transthyretin-like family-containing protein n=1 Tax=Parastrongyloides trichosuri TaxID=131310 RepID=A0A0N4ZH84_PARTI
MYDIFFNIFQFLTLVNILNGLLQGIELKGRILCNSKPVAFLEMTLMEEDILFDDFLRFGKTNDSGHFLLYGRDEEFTIIEPYIIFNHTCTQNENTGDDNLIIIYPPDTAFNSFIHFSEYFHNFGDIELTKL